MTAWTAKMSRRRLSSGCRYLSTISSSSSATSALFTLTNVVPQQRTFATARPKANNNNKHKVVIVGGGAGGCSVAAKLARKLGPSNVVVIEPADTHYYQPLWTLVGAGLKTLQASARPMSQVLPSGIHWVKDRAAAFSPRNNTVTTSDGTSLEYEYLVVAMGIQLRYNDIKGVSEALETPGSGVCSNYSPLHVNKTFEAIKNFESGNAVFTFPNTPIKCAGAPQKIMYLAEDYFVKHGKKKDANIIFCTSLPVLFGVKHYADKALWPIVKKRGIQVNLRHNLVEVVPHERKAIFELLDKPGETTTIQYSMLHVTPPMGPHDVMKTSAEDLCDAAGYVSVDKSTLQHVKYPNVFSLGDCSSLPTSKTAAAVAAQNAILVKNLSSVMANKKPEAIYDGYTSCPLVTSDRTCVLAEFDYDAQPLETFPIDQTKERTSMYLMKSQIMPWLYWKLMLNGRWNGPGAFRKFMKFGK